MVGLTALDFMLRDSIVGRGGGGGIGRGGRGAPVRIQAEIPAGYSGNYIQFKPDRVVFQQPASLTISYSNCSLAKATQLKVAQVSDMLQIIQYVPSTNDLDAHTVTGQLQHFSNYAVAW